MNFFPVKVIKNGILWGRASEGTVKTLKDNKKNMITDAFKNKLITVEIDDIEYVRTITANSADTFTFDDLVASVSATAIMDNTANGGGKVTITAIPKGTDANGYKVVAVKGVGAEAITEAEFSDGTLTITLGTDTGAKATAALGTDGVNGIVILAKEVGELNNYSIQVTQNSGADVPLSTGLFEETDTYIIGLGADANGDPDDTKNTVANIVNALNDNVYFNALFIAASNDGSGVYDTPIAAVAIEGGADPAINATANDVKTAVDLLTNEFSAAANTAGVMAIVAPINFAGGVDEVKPIDRTEYYVV